VTRDCRFERNSTVIPSHQRTGLIQSISSIQSRECGAMFNPLPMFLIHLPDLRSREKNFDGVWGTRVKIQKKKRKKSSRRSRGNNQKLGPTQRLCWSSREPCNRADGFQYMERTSEAFKSSWISVDRRAYMDRRQDISRCCRFDSGRGRIVGETFCLILLVLLAFIASSPLREYVSAICFCQDRAREKKKKQS